MRKQTALSLAISSVLYGTMAFSGAVYAQDDEAQAEDELLLEEIIVTGSRIKRSSEFDAGGQIVSMDRASIDAMAELNMADVLRASPLNAYGSFNERSGSSAQSNATFNLRGLGYRAVFPATPKLVHIPEYPGVMLFIFMQVTEVLYFRITRIH